MWLMFVWTYSMSSDGVYILHRGCGQRNNTAVILCYGVITWIYLFFTSVLICVSDKDEPGLGLEIWTWGLYQIFTLKHVIV